MVDENFVRQVASAEEMMALGVEMAEGLVAGDVVALQGGLGAGKTHFTKGIAEGLGCHGEVTSPTFSLAHEYSGGRLPLFHFDFYRMETENEVLRIGWDEYLDEDGIMVVEWPDKFPDLLPMGAIWLKLTTAGEGRVVTKGGGGVIS
ncbi:MAG: tRNA (adenosine(37)-N6)-threonylcarbamoyltransferase complex ATPase subunit type 1 TsaE [Verrucomicrobiae bacterium]|nr:tRNA (adenosine(37)-N6)-threonylcarbamoyltransferase complex ATPase subunit type 1 TsaE [Verrucomicrobiae bacterium]